VKRREMWWREERGQLTSFWAPWCPGALTAAAGAQLPHSAVSALASWHFCWQHWSCSWLWCCRNI